MARYPAADWRPVTRYLPGGSSARATSGQRRLIFHTAVSSATSLFSTMNVSGTPTSHFYVAGNGNVEQYVDTSIQSSANLDGNHDCITVETQDKGAGFPDWTGSNVPKWTDAQVDALAKLAAWCNRIHGIPLVQLPSSRPGTTGVGWHRLGIDGNFPPGLLSGRVAGGEVWSSSTGKACPGDNRIRQTVDEVIPRAKGSEPEDDAMTPEDRDFIRNQVDALQKQLAAFRENAAERDQALADDLQTFRENTQDRDVAMREQLATITDLLSQP